MYGEPIWDHEEATLDFSSPAATSTPTLSFINGKHEVTIEPEKSYADKEARGDVFESVSSQNLSQTEEKIETTSNFDYSLVDTGATQDGSDESSQDVTYSMSISLSTVEPKYVYDKEQISVESTPPSFVMPDPEDKTLIEEGNLIPNTPSGITVERSFSLKPHQPSVFPTNTTATAISEVAPSKPIDTTEEISLSIENGSGQETATIQIVQVTQESATLQATESDKLDHTMFATTEKKSLLPSFTDTTDITYTASNYQTIELGIKEYAFTSDTPMSATHQTDNMSTPEHTEKQAISKSTIMVTSSPDVERITSLKSLLITEEEGSGGEPHDLIFTKLTLQHTVTNDFEATSPHTPLDAEIMMLQTEETLLTKPSEVNITDSSENLFSTQEEESLNEISAISTVSTVEKTSKYVSSGTHSETFPFSEADGSGDQSHVILTTVFPLHTTTHSEQNITTTAVYTVQRVDETVSVKTLSEETEANQATISPSAFSSSYMETTTEPVPCSNISEEVIQEPFTATVPYVMSEEGSGDQSPDRHTAGETSAVHIIDASEMVTSTESSEKKTTDKCIIESISQGLPSTKSESLLLFQDTEGSGNQIIDAFATTSTTSNRDHFKSTIPMWDGTLLPHSEGTLLERTSESPAIAFSIPITVPSTHELTREQETTIATSTMTTSHASTLIPAFLLSDVTTLKVETHHTNGAETEKPSSTITSKDVTSNLLEDDISGENILDRLSTASFMQVHSIATDDQHMTTRTSTQSEAKESISTTTTRTFTVDHAQSISIESSSIEIGITPDTGEFNQNTTGTMVGTSHYKTESPFNTRYVENSGVQISNIVSKDSHITSAPTQEIPHSEGSGEESGEFEDGVSGDFSNTVVESTPPSQVPLTKDVLTTKSGAIMGTELAVHSTVMEVSSEFAHSTVTGTILAFTVGDGSGDQNEDILNTVSVTSPTSITTFGVRETFTTTSSSTVTADHFSLSTSQISHLESIHNATYLMSTAIDMETLGASSKDQESSILEGSADNMSETTEASKEYSVRTDEAEISYAKSTVDYSDVESATLSTKLTSESSSQIPSSPAQTDLMSSSLESGSGDTEDTTIETEGADDNGSGDLVSTVLESSHLHGDMKDTTSEGTEDEGIDDESSGALIESAAPSQAPTTDIITEKTNASMNIGIKDLPLAVPTSTDLDSLTNEDNLRKQSTVTSVTLTPGTDSIYLISKHVDIDSLVSTTDVDKGTLKLFTEDGGSGDEMLVNTPSELQKSTSATVGATMQSATSTIATGKVQLSHSTTKIFETETTEDNLEISTQVSLTTSLPIESSYTTLVDEVSVQTSPESLVTGTDVTTPVFSVIYQDGTDKEVTTIVPSSNEIRSSKITARLHDTKSITSPVIIFTEEIKDEDELFSTVTDSMRDHSTKKEFINKDDIIIDADTVSVLKPSSPFASTIITEEAAGITAVTMTPQSSSILTEEPEGSGTDSPVLPSSDLHVPTQSLEGSTAKSIDLSSSVKAEETETKPTFSVDIIADIIQTVAPSKMMPHLSTSTNSAQTTLYSAHSTTHYNTGKSYPSQTTLHDTYSTNQPTFTTTDSVSTTSQHSHIIPKPSHTTTSQPKTIFHVTSTTSQSEFRTTQAMPKTSHSMLTSVLTDNFSGDHVSAEDSGMQTSIPDVITSTDTSSPTTLTADVNSTLHGMVSATSGYNMDKTTNSKQSVFILVSQGSVTEEGSGLISELTVSSGSDVLGMAEATEHGEPRSETEIETTIHPNMEIESNTSVRTATQSDVTVQPTTIYEVTKLVQTERVEVNDRPTTVTVTKSSEMPLFDSTRGKTSSPLLSEESSGDMFSEIFTEVSTAVSFKVSTDHRDFSTTHSDALVSLSKETDSTTYAPPILTTSRVHPEAVFEITLTAQPTKDTSAADDLSTTTTIPMVFMSTSENGKYTQYTQPTKQGVQSTQGIPIMDGDAISEPSLVESVPDLFDSETFSKPESKTPLENTPVYESKTSVSSTEWPHISDKNPLQRLSTVSPLEHFTYETNKEEVTTVIPSSDETSPASPMQDSYDSFTSSVDKLNVSEEQKTFGQTEETAMAILKSTDYTTSSADGIQMHSDTTASPKDISDDTILVESSDPNPEALNGTQRPRLNMDLGYTVIGEPYDIAGMTLF